MKLYKVKPTHHLKWHTPKGWAHKDTHRGSEGYIVDLDAPLELMFCGTQMRKLTPIESGTPNKIEHPLALRLIAEEIARLKALEPKEEEKPSTPAAAAPTPALVEPVKETKTKGGAPALPSVDVPKKAGG